jgi:predicted phage gp36 major capsid-like protein
MHVREFFRRITTSRYARTLEDALAHARAIFAQQRAEIDRLRAENRALLNSILGIAGVPPLPATDADFAAVEASLHTDAPLPSPPAANRTRLAPHAAAPMRRRSWPQVNRKLEFESAQKEKPAAEPLPPARV